MSKYSLRYPGSQTLSNYIVPLERGIKFCANNLHIFNVIKVRFGVVNGTWASVIPGNIRVTVKGIVEN
jgi:hypothetical protein